MDRAMSDQAGSNIIFSWACLSHIIRVSSQLIRATPNYSLSYCGLETAILSLVLRCSTVYRFF